MPKRTYNIIGQMSGTSLDGIDLVYVKIGFKSDHFFEILLAETIPYSNSWKERLSNGFHLKGEALNQLDSDYGSHLAEVISEFIQRKGISDIDFIASHGHTIFHKPKEKYTLQIGNGPEICDRTGIKTICDFRVQDVLLGGQGAPLVPIGDKLLFSTYTHCLNLGGFANVSYQEKEKRRAFDICPANIVLNHYVAQLDLVYDPQGENASKGSINKRLLKELNELNYYKEDAPKSLGYEYVFSEIFPRVDSFKLNVYDQLRTLVEHIAIQVAIVLNEKPGACLITGGGAFNEFLIGRIREHSNNQLVLPNNVIINYKEALIFAFLGYLKNNDEINCLKSVTGASKDHSSGVIYRPQN